MPNEQKPHFTLITNLGLKVTSLYKIWMFSDLVCCVNQVVLMLIRCMYMTKAERTVSKQGHLQPRRHLKAGHGAGNWKKWSFTTKFQSLCWDENLTQAEICHVSLIVHLIIGQVTSTRLILMSPVNVNHVTRPIIDTLD